MLRQGDGQHDIAVWFGVNDGRVAEIAVGASGSAKCRRPILEVAAMGGLIRKRQKLLP